MASFAFASGGAWAASARLSTRTRRSVARCSAAGAGGGGGGGGDEDGGVRFRRDGAEEALTSFRAPQAKGVATPNERLLADVQATMEALGVSATGAGVAAPKTSAPRDISHVRPLAALGGAAGAAAISAALWAVLQALIGLYVAHPYAGELYVVQRLTAVVRVAAVGMLALASGVSGVTALGLALLGVRVAVDAVRRRQ